MDRQRVEGDAVWLTVPNAVTVVRLACLPVFVWLAVSTAHHAIAAWFLGGIGATDWVDGYLARRFAQVSNVGKIIDPVADRLLVITSIFTVAGLGAVPWWFAGATLAREVVVSGMTLALAAAGASRIDVLWWGKVSTFALMTDYPWFFLTYAPEGHAARWLVVAHHITWAVGVFGLVLAWLVLGAYVPPALSALRRGREGRRASKIIHHGDSRRP